MMRFGCHDGPLRTTSAQCLTIIKAITKYINVISIELPMHLVNASFYCVTLVAHYDNNDATQRDVGSLRQQLLL